MRYPTGIPPLFEGADDIVAIHGGEMWEDTIAFIPEGGMFLPMWLIGELPSIAHLSEFTQKRYIRAVMHAVESRDNSPLEVERGSMGRVLYYKRVR